MRAPTLISALCAALFCAETLPVQADDNPAQAAARAALLQAQQQPGTPGTNAPAAPPVAQAQPPAAPVPAAPAPAQPAAAPVTAPPATAASAAPVSAAGDNAAQAAARAALLQNQPSVTATTSSTTAAPAITAASAGPKIAGPPAVITPTKVPTPASAVPMTLAPVPPPPLTADQASRLQQLDAKYSANQISPLDYFTQREAILKGQ